MTLVLIPIPAARWLPGGRDSWCPVGCSQLPGHRSPPWLESAASQKACIWPRGKEKFKFLPCLHPSAKLPWRNLARYTSGRYRAAGGWVSLAALQRRWIPLGRESTEIPLC